MERDIPGKKTGVENSARSSEIPKKFKDAKLPLADINVLNQPRQTFEEIEGLAQNIAKRDLLNPLTVAGFSKEGCQSYIDTINNIWGTNHTIDELTPVVDEQGETRYFILLAGERRFRAFKKLDSTGCMECQAEFGEGPCFDRHFETRDVRVTLANDFDPIDTVFIQASENIHMRVPPHEEAHFYDALLKTIRQKEPAYPVSRFANDVGRSADTIRTALRYCDLPQDIQEHVEQGVISYGIATEISRLKLELNLPDDELQWWKLRAIANNYKVADFRELVSNEIRTRKSGQTLLGIFSDAQEEELRRSMFKKVVASEMVNANWQFIAYFKKVNALFESQEVGKKDSPFSVESPLRTFRALVTEQRKLLPHLRTLLPEIEYNATEDTLQEADLILTELLETAEPSPITFGSVN